MKGGWEQQTLATSATGAAAAGADPAPGRFTPTPLPGNLQQMKHISQLHISQPHHKHG